MSVYSAGQTGPIVRATGPYAEGAKGALDCYAPQNLKYQLTTRERRPDLTTDGHGSTLEADSRQPLPDGRLH